MSFFVLKSFVPFLWITFHFPSVSPAFPTVFRFSVWKTIVEKNVEFQNSSIFKFFPVFLI